MSLLICRREWRGLKIKRGNCCSVNAAGEKVVPAEKAELGNRLTVTVADGDVRQATVVPKPFIDPEKEIPKS